MATAVNEYFLEKFQNLKDLNVSGSHVEATCVLENFLQKKQLPPEGFVLCELTEDKVRTLIRKIKGKKSCGIDWICGLSLKCVAYDLLPELTEVINITIRNGRFPSRWKCAKVLPAYKNKGNRFDIKYYRPLSNLPEVSKLAERAMHDQLSEYLRANDLIHSNHHGFLRNCSTSTALQQMIDTWLQSLDKGKIVSTLLLDLSAGFDIINHSLLLKKLKLYGFHGNALGWVSSYLEHRYQVVQVESALSPVLPVPHGVPQGSILGPLLFLLFINELPFVVKQTSTDTGQDVDKDADIVVYADDNSPFTADRDPNLLQIKIQVLASPWK